ncbi:glycosyltransferase family 4 protein [Mariprofundus erugo]|uniref:Glycosyltransferase family 4 protein n=1 Tax=Mariprofundus erugo TaxID=2528639 RepID=A0A5R9GJD8_9PROT|nr:glycosyltransferase family 4 protein [Mariprofundus erugo]TLS66746.1 glycosyltransferase family 4 protein [Mariprofundus erugo]
MSFWFWQTEVSPHMVGLAEALSTHNVEVIFVAEQMTSIEREKLGWGSMRMRGAKLKFVENEFDVCVLVKKASNDSIHFCQGLRGNGLVCIAQRELAKRKLRQWAMVETVNDYGWKGILKRIEYRRLFFLWRNRLEGVLSIGYSTSDWVISCGVSTKKVFPFTYFLQNENCLIEKNEESDVTFRLIFVGQLIERKALELLILALEPLHRLNLQLLVIGTGPLASELRATADALIPGCVRWAGKLPMLEIPAYMKQSDCLVLPSRHDGWGAVVSEALMVGTPVITSDRCGAAGVVAESGVGGVFKSGDVEGLTELIAKAIERGRVSDADRLRVAGWADCLSADFGAKYLLSIVNYMDGIEERPLPYWLKERT